MLLRLLMDPPPDSLQSFFTTQGPLIFSTNGTPSSRASTLTKITTLLGFGTSFYGTSPGTNYGSNLLYDTVRSLLGTNTLQDLQTNVLIPAYQLDTSTYTTFSNLNFAEFIGQTALASDVALATTAAPYYLPIYNFDSHNYLDGGIYQNNPAAFGKTLAQMIKPTAKRICVLSVGTGRGTAGFYDPAPPPSSFMVRLRAQLAEFLRTEGIDINAMDPPDPDEILSVNFLFDLFTIAQVGGQESVARQLFLESSYTLEQLYYYRFQPQLDTNLNTELDNTDPSILTYYEDTAETWFEDDIANITNFLGHLTA